MGGSLEEKQVHRKRNRCGAEEGETGIPATELCLKQGISNATYYQWKSQVFRRSGVRAATAA
jgi:hypothetical protein